MANFNAYPTDELMKQLDKLENIDQVSKKMVKKRNKIFFLKMKIKNKNPDGTR